MALRPAPLTALPPCPSQTPPAQPPPVWHQLDAPRQQQVAQQLAVLMRRRLCLPTHREDTTND